MSLHHSARQQKLLEAIYSFFNDMADRTNQDKYALDACKRLLFSRSDMLGEVEMMSFSMAWGSLFPEEEPLLVTELIWALEILKDDMMQQMRKIEVQSALEHDPRAIFRIISDRSTNKLTVPVERIIDDF